jgi:hypothetical protein
LEQGIAIYALIADDEDRVAREIRDNGRVSKQRLHHLLAVRLSGRRNEQQHESGDPRRSGGYDQGLANVADFVGDGFRVIAPSRFGYLGTPVPPDSSPAAQADAHAALLSELNISKPIVVGISAARSAIELAIRHPTESPP